MTVTSSAGLLILLLAVGYCLSLTEAFNCPSCNNTCNCKCNNVTKLVACVSQKLKEIPIDLPKDVRHLDLSNNQISNLSGLINFTELVSLQLSNNLISTWSNTWLIGLPALSDLKLSQNQLTKPPEPLCSRLTALQHLYLDNNNLEGSFSKDYSYCTRLGRLTLTDNPYMSIDNTTLCSLAGPKAQNKPSQLLSLKLNRLKLNTVQPDSLNCLAHRLESLDLSQNALPQSSLEGLIGGSCLTQLKTLNLRRSSQLQTVTYALVNCLSALQTLMLDSNSNITVLHETALAVTKNLRVLYLNKTGISNWTSGSFDQLRNLRSLELSFTPVATIGGRNGSDSNALWLLNNGTNFKNLSLANASLVCDCSIYWLWQQLRDNPQVRKKIVGGADSLKCAGPSDARGARLTQFNRLSACTNSDNNGGFFTRQMVIILASSGAGALLLITIVVVVAVAIIRRRRRHRGAEADGSQEPPRLTFSGASSAASSADDLRDPLVRPDNDSRGRDSIWIRLRRLLRERRNNSSAQTATVRRSIYDPQQPEEYLSADA